ncbi:MAG: hypothetical protein ACRDYV_16645, partial [Acidimicrobiia bacterium]
MFGRPGRGPARRERRKTRAPRPVGAPTGLRGLRARLDSALDALSPGSLRRGAEAFNRRLGITRSGQVALVGFVLLWVMARVVAGTAMYLFAYGLLLLVVVCYLIAPRRL